MTLTTAMRKPLGAELSSSLRVRPSRRELVRARTAARELPITIGDNAPFEAQSPWAAPPERLVEQDATGTTWWLHMPGADRDNTEALWDPERSTLSISAWSRPVASRGRAGGSPGRLLWYSSLWQPGADGARATAAVARGWVGVHLPYAQAA